MTKPLVFAELLVRIRALLRRRSPTNNNVVKVGDLQIDLAIRHVKREGKPIRLTTKEYAHT